MGWKRTNDCLMCGQGRCLEEKDQPGVGYCYRFSTMHRNGKPFIKQGVKPASRKDQPRTVLKGGLGENFSEKFLPQKTGQAEFSFEE